MSNLFLLTLIGLALTGIFLGMKIAMKIAQSVTRWNPGVPVISTSPSFASNHSEKGGGALSSSFIALFLFGLVAIGIVESQNVESSSTSDSIVDSAPSTPQSEALPKANLENKVPVKMVSYETRMVNVKPFARAFYDYYGIQVGAMMDEGKAIQLKMQLADYEVVIIEEDGLFKVVVGEFLSHQDAIDFREGHSILKSGFIRKVDGAILDK